MDFEIHIVVFDYNQAIIALVHQSCYGVVYLKSANAFLNKTLRYDSNDLVAIMNTINNALSKHWAGLKIFPMYAASKPVAL